MEKIGWGLEKLSWIIPHGVCLFQELRRLCKDKCFHCGSECCSVSVKVQGREKWKIHLWFLSSGPEVLTLSCIRETMIGYLPIIIGVICIEEKGMYQST